MKRLILMSLLSLSLVACGSNKSPAEEPTVTDGSSVVTTSNSLVIYYDYSENMGDTSNMSVDAITSASLDHETIDGVEKNNLLVIKDEIVAKTGADVFSVRATEPYDADYEKMVYVAQEDQDNNKQFEFVEDNDHIGDYDTIYIGMPVWWSELPQPLHVFLNKHANDFDGKTIIPFGIHRGSGFGQMVSQIKEIAKGAKVSDDGYTVSATTSNADVQSAVDEWLKQ